MDDSLPDVPAGAALTCSSRGCRAVAHHAVLWNNPRLHTPERRKTWLACDEHRDPLSAFLSARGFLRGVEPLGGTEVEDAPGRSPVGER